MDHFPPSIILSAEALVDVVRGDLCDVVGEVAGQVELAQLRHGALLLVVVAQLLVHRLYIWRDGYLLLISSSQEMKFTNLADQIPWFLDLDGVGGLVVEGHHRVARLVVQDGDLVLQGRDSIALSRIKDFCFYEWKSHSRPDT